MSKLFCPHPWHSVDITNDGRLRPCCKIDSSKFEGRWKNYYISSGINGYFDQEHIKELQDSFTKNERHPACIRCWKDEDANLESKRLLDSKTYNSSPNNKFLGLPLGNLCNLKCRICGPNSSTTWIKEHKDLFGEVYKNQNWFKDKNIWTDILNFSKSTYEIHMHGGEPFLHDLTEHLELLETLNSAGASKNIRLHYNTNGTVFPKEVYWNH